MPEVFLPDYGGYAYYHIPTSYEFYRVKVWGLSRESFDAALAFMCVDKIEGLKMPPYIKTSYDTLRDFMLVLSPTDEGLLVEEILKATATHYAQFKS